MTEKLGTKEGLLTYRQIVVFIGPEGSGKTTQALLLAEATGMPYISTGDILRELAANDITTRFGEACRKMFEENTYLDGPTLLEILVERLRQPDTRDGFILDGGMRSLEETRDFQMILNEADRGDLFVRVVQLLISEETSLSRLTGDGGRGRKDGTQDGVRSRLEKYKYLLSERLELIMTQPGWSLSPLDAERLVEEVYGDVCEVLTD